MDKTVAGLEGLLGGSDNNQISYGVSGQLNSLPSSCCDPKVDLITLLVTLGAIAAISVFLRQAVIDNNVMGARRKRRNISWYSGNFSKVIKISMVGFYEARKWNSLSFSVENYLSKC